VLRCVGLGVILLASETSAWATLAGARATPFADDTRQARFVCGDGGDLAHSTGSFVVMGIHHILTWVRPSADSRWAACQAEGCSRLEKIITAFTIAHSVTLSLALLQIITLPDRLIEAG